MPPHWGLTRSRSWLHSRTLGRNSDDAKKLPALSARICGSALTFQQFVVEPGHETFGTSKRPSSNVVNESPLALAVVETNDMGTMTRRRIVVMILRSRIFRSIVQTNSPSVIWILYHTSSRMVSKNRRRDTSLRETVTPTDALERLLWS